MLDSSALPPLTSVDEAQVCKMKLLHLLFCLHVLCREEDTSVEILVVGIKTPKHLIHQLSVKTKVSSSAPSRSLAFNNIKLKLL